MANQVYFPQYKEIFDAESGSYILISHPQTQRAYKITAQRFFDAINTLGLIDNIYTADGTLTEARVVDGNGNTFTITDTTSIALDATDGNTTSALSMTQEVFRVTTEDATFGAQGLFNSDGISNVLSTTLTGTGLGQLVTGPATATLQADGTASNQASITANSSSGPFARLTATDGTITTEIELNPGNIDLQFTSTAELRLNGSAGTKYQVPSSNGTGAAPTWNKGIVSSGTGTLVNGTVNISDTAVLAGCKILVTPTAFNATVIGGVPRVVSKTNGTGFTVTSYVTGGTTQAATDQSSFDYVITL